MQRNHFQRPLAPLQLRERPDVRGSRDRRSESVGSSSAPGHDVVDRPPMCRVVKRLTAVPALCSIAGLSASDRPSVLLSICHPPRRSRDQVGTADVERTGDRTVDFGHPGSWHRAECSGVDVLFWDGVVGVTVALADGSRLKPSQSQPAVSPVWPMTQSVSSSRPISLVATRTIVTTTSSLVVDTQRYPLRARNSRRHA